MARLLRWSVGLLLVATVAIGALVLLPFSSWLPGGTVADIPKAEVVNGTAFNRLFPEPQSGEQLVFTQEKRGFSQARLRQGDELKALLAISDTVTAPSAREKFLASSERLKGWPLVEQGQQASALLVGERFQVKVIGQGKGLDPMQRHDLLGAFDLQGLAALAPATPVSSRALPAGEQKPLKMPTPTRSRQAEPEPAA